METVVAIFDYAVMAAGDRADTSKEAIRQRLVLLRMAISGESQVAFCTRTGITTNAWNNLERGRNRISIDTALDLARTTGVSLDWIYRGPNYEHALPGELAAKIRFARASLDGAEAKPSERMTGG